MTVKRSTTRPFATWPPPLSSELQTQALRSLRGAIRGRSRALEVKTLTQNAYRVLCGVGLSTQFSTQ